MGFLEDLATARYGARFRVPPSWEVAEQHATSVMLVDRAEQVGWQLGFHEVGLSLRPEDDETLARDIERHTRALFEQCYRQLPPQGFDRPARTSDPNWSPVLYARREALGGAPVLRVLHRLWYQPGREAVMGHLLIPVRRGLIELRVTATDHMTGVRESVLFASAAAGSNLHPDELLRQLGPGYHDDPVHDAAFPTQVLSRVRRAFHWLRDQARVEVFDPPAEDEAEVVVGDRFAFALPARHRPIPGKCDREGVETSRVTFSGTDGLETLLVRRVPPESGTLLDVAREASSVPGTRETVTASQLPARDGRAHVRTLRRYERDAAAHYMGSRWFVDEAGWWVIALLHVSDCVDEAEVFERVESVVRSYRMIDPTPPPGAKRAQRPWWRFW